MGSLRGELAETEAFHRLLKQTLDPNGVIAPGRYDFGEPHN
jgi:hypothetical protein